MKRFGVWTLAIFLAFGLGLSGLPGKAMAWATTRMLDDGTISLDSTMERGVRQALVLEDSHPVGPTQVTPASTIGR